MSRSMPRLFAPLIVAQRSASSGDMPPCTSIQSSQCRPSPSRWPCAPVLTETPSLPSFSAIFASLKWLNSSSGAIVRRRERGSRTNGGTNFESRGSSQTFVFWYQ